MKKIKVLLFAVMLVLPLAVIFAQDSSTNTDSTSVNQEVPKPPNMPTPPPVPPVPSAFSAGTPMPSASIGMMGLPKTVVATSDGGIVIVQGNRITKFDKDLEITKSIELKDAENTGDKNTQ